MGPRRDWSPPGRTATVGSGAMRTVKAGFWLLVGVALGVGSLFFGFKGATGIVSDGSVWDKGTAAPRVRVGGRVKSNRIILKTYELDVDFQDTEGRPHHGHEEFTTLFTSVDQERSPEVHYDASDPNRFVLSWARDVTGGRWMAALFFLVMGPVFLLGGWLYAKQHWLGRGPATPPVAPGTAR